MSHVHTQLHLYSVAWRLNFDKQISSYERGGGVRGLGQWIRTATDYKIICTLRHRGHSTMHRVTPVSGTTVTMYLHLVQLEYKYTVLVTYMYCLATMRVYMYELQKSQVMYKCTSCDMHVSGVLHAPHTPINHHCIACAQNLYNPHLTDVLYMVTTCCHVHRVECVSTNVHVLSEAATFTIRHLP